MAIGMSNIAEEYSSAARRVFGAENKQMPMINICVIRNVDINKKTASIFIPKNNVYKDDVQISFPSKGSGFGAYFMPAKQSLALVAVTCYGEYYILGGISLSKDTSNQKLFEGENLILALSGASIKQDFQGNIMSSSSNGNGSLYSSNLCHYEIATGKEEKTLSSSIFKGIALGENNLNNVLIKKDSVKVVNYEEYYSKFNTIKTYSQKDILKNNIIDEQIKTNILNDADSVLDKIKNAESTDLKLNKNMSLIIQKGNAVSAKINSVDDLCNLKETDFITSESGNDIVFKLSVVDDKLNEKASITIDSEGNGYLNFKKLVVNGKII